MNNFSLCGSAVTQTLGGGGAVAFVRLALTTPRISFLFDHSPRKLRRQVRCVLLHRHTFQQCSNEFESIQYEFETKLEVARDHRSSPSHRSDQMALLCVTQTGRNFQRY
jgi:hypothetical protein